MNEGGTRRAQHSRRPSEILRLQACFVLPFSLFLYPSSTLYVLPSSLHSFPLSLSVSALSLSLLPPPLSLAFAFVLLPASLAAVHCTKLILNGLKGYHNSCSSMPTISLTYFHLNFKPATPTPSTSPFPSSALLIFLLENSK